MKLFCNVINGEVFYAVYDADLFRFNHTTNIPLFEFVVDEINPDNKALCIDLKNTEWKFDKQEYRKYYVLNNELFSRDGWIEYNPILI